MITVAFYMVGAYIVFMIIFYMLMKHMFPPIEVTDICEKCKRNMDISWDDWFSILKQELIQRGYTQEVDIATAESDYRLGIPPARSAELFVESQQE